MWFWIIAVIDAVVLLVIPHYIVGVPYWLHLPCVLVFCLWVPGESKVFRSLGIWPLIFNYEFIGSPLLDPSEPCIYAIHPHGVFTATTIMAFALNKDTLHVKPAASSILFILPILKEFAGLGGAIRANRADILATLKCGESVAICPGGIRELPGLDPHRVAEGGGFVQRDGFIKLAKAANVPVVPIWVDGEEDLYDVWLWWPWLQRHLLSWFYYPGLVPSWGLWWLPFWPKSRKITLQVGDPILPQDLTKHKFYSYMDILKKKLL